MLMASVDFEKLKNISTIKSRIRHCNKEERLIHKHSNKDIDLSKTHQNISLTKLDYKGACKKFDDRIKHLDETTNTNKRRDRVLCFGLNIPAPEEMRIEDTENFFRDVIEIMEKRFREENILSADIHYDEIHNYYDPVEDRVRTSTPHLQAYVIPEINGVLDGKKFSSKKNMISLNKEIDKLCKERYHCQFMTGKEPRKRSVEELKAITNKETERRIEQIHRTEEKIRELEDCKRALSGEVRTAEQIKSKMVKPKLFRKDVVEVPYKDYMDNIETAMRVDEIDKILEENKRISRRNEREKAQIAKERHILDEDKKAFERSFTDFDIPENSIDRQIKSFDVMQENEIYKGFIRFKGLESEYNNFSIEVAKNVIRDRVKKTVKTIQKNYDEPTL